MSKQLLAGVDIGGTKTAVVLSLDPPQTICRHAFATEPQKGPDFAIELIVSTLRRALTEHGVCQGDLVGIGISCGGPLDPERGLIQSPPNLSSWVDVPICKILEQEFGAPCFLENDANAGALAEHKYGAGQGSRNLAFLTMGTGLGAGLILNGELLRGVTHAAGEIGHVRLTRSGPVGFGKAGSVEGWASGGGMAQVARSFVKAALARGENTLLLDANGTLPGEISARDVGDAARKGDRVARAIVKKAGEKLGDTLAILVDILNPERIVVGGLALRFGDDILDPARKQMMREALPNSAQGCTILPARLGERIGDVAALCVALEGLAKAGARFSSPKEPSGSAYADGVESVVKQV